MENVDAGVVVDWVPFPLQHAGWRLAQSSRCVHSTPVFSDYQLTILSWTTRAVSYATSARSHPSPMAQTPSGSLIVETGTVPTAKMPSSSPERSTRPPPLFATWVAVTTLFRASPCPPLSSETSCGRHCSSWVNEWRYGSRWGKDNSNYAAKRVLATFKAWKKSLGLVWTARATVLL